MLLWLKLMHVRMFVEEGGNQVEEAPKTTQIIGVDTRSVEKLISAKGVM